MSIFTFFFHSFCGCSYVNVLLHLLTYNTKTMKTPPNKLGGKQDHRRAIARVYKQKKSFILKQWWSYDKLTSRKYGKYYLRVSLNSKLVFSGLEESGST